MNEITFSDTAGTKPGTQRRVGAVSLLVAMLIATFAAVGVSSEPASASAFGCNQYGSGLSYNGIGARKGTYCAQISGTGTWVSFVYGQGQVNNALFGTTCNYFITAEFFDSSGRWYETQRTPTRNRCYSAAGFSERININRHMRKGFMCSTLFSNGARQTSVCHSIY